MESKFSNLKPQQLKLIRILRLLRALHLVFLMKATNKSALTSTELLLKELDNFDKNVSMAHAEIFEPVGNNETPLKYTAGMILAVPIDCELFNVEDPSLVRIAIQTPDQKIMLVTPKSTDFITKADGCR